MGWTPVTLADGKFFAGFFKAQPQTASLLREAYKAKGLPVPEPPKINDTSLLTVGEKYKVGDIVERLDEGGYRKVDEDEVREGNGKWLRVTKTDAQSQIEETEPLKGQ
jgi:hypothetical protein